MPINKENIATQMRKGIMDYCFLIILARRRVYPSEIIAHLKQAGLSIKEATVYTVLNRLTKEGKVTYQWEESTQGPPRKYFLITPLGHEYLQATQQVWDEISGSISKLNENHP
jgi:hypothetical protein